MEEPSLHHIFMFLTSSGWVSLREISSLEYVFIHELVHLVEKNHTHRFHALVEQYYPTWKEARKRLNELPLDYVEKEYNDEDEDIQRHL